MIIDYVGEYRIELETGPIKNPGYRIYKATWQSHKDRKPVKNQRPRWKFISVFSTEDECRKEIERLRRCQY